MNPREREKLIDVLSLLMDHPCSQIFIEPVEPGLDCPHDYFELIPEPSSLREVMNSLENQTCLSKEIFLKKVELCWSNAETYYGKHHPIGIVAAEARRRFHKIVAKYTIDTPEAFCREIQRLQRNVGMLLGKISGRERNVKQLNGLNDLLTLHELENLMIGCDMLTKSKDHKRVREIIAEHQPEILTDAPTQTIMATTLKRSTYKELKSFISGALQAQGLKYPS